jgi:soluble lytic murein transglycosylase-like protein
MAVRRGTISAPLRAFLILAATLGPLQAETLDPIANWELLLDISDPELQTEWGFWYENARGLEGNYERAVKLYCAAARQGHSPAQMRLGWMYANGVGVERNTTLAGAWLRLVAAQGDMQARRFLALLNYPPRVKPSCLPPEEVIADFGAPREKSPERKRIEEWVQRFAPQYQLDPRLVIAVVQTESSFNANARSHANAHGLMQLIPETAQRFGVKDVYDPVQNLHGGMAYLRWLLEYFRGNLRYALAGYNAGEAAVAQYQGIPPYKETRDYVSKVIRAYGQTTHTPIAQSYVGSGTRADGPQQHRAERR